MPFSNASAPISRARRAAPESVVKKGLPEKDPSAVKFEELTFEKAISDHLKVMDQTAFALCSEGNMPIIVFDMNCKGNLTRLLKGEKVGTLVHV